MNAKIFSMNSVLYVFLSTCFLGAQNAYPALTTIADAPVFASNKVPPNLMFTLSVEWPTGVVAAYNDNAGTYVDAINAATTFSCPGRQSVSGTSGIGVCYFPTMTYLGYFESDHCYDYDAVNNYYYPVAAASSHACSSRWSGNYLNWATSHAIDIFRAVLAGGDRSTDIDGTTIVEKAKHTGQGGYSQFPIKRVGTAASGTVAGLSNTNTVSPYNVTNLFLRVHNGSTAIQLGSDTTTSGVTIEVCDQPSFSGCGATFGTASGAPLQRVLRVKVCDQTQTADLTTSAFYDRTAYKCSAYTRTVGASTVTNYKPIGLIQQYADTMRYGVVGYLNADGGTYPGGVLRARIKDVGPLTINPIGAGAVNSLKEWDGGSGIFIQNPDATDATASGVTDSGVINYLNKFGKKGTATTFRSKDPLSELYYTGLRYLRNLAPVPGYMPGTLTTAMKDGFPVINWTTADDPIKWSCQKNFVVGIADENTWCDVDLPGNSLTGYSSSCPGHTGTASDPDASVNVRTLDNRIGALEGGMENSGNLGTYYFHNSSRNDTWHIAGLAYWANTNDIRPDDPLKPQTIGRQTMQTYFLDVKETGSTGGKNQMWMAAKYGGFNDINHNGIPANQASWDENSDGVPDNYLLADRPDVMKKSLNDVFQSILSKTLSAAGASFTSSQVQAADSIYTVQYSSDDWTGDVSGNQITIDAAGAVTLTNIWRANAKIGAQHWPGSCMTLPVSSTTDTGCASARKVVTFNRWATTPAGLPFTYTNLSGITPSGWSSNLATSFFNAPGSNPQNLIDYLRGKRQYESSLFRTRSSAGILGDIVDSEAKAIAKPQAPYKDTYNPGYNAWMTASAQQNRRKMIYVASNDGMLHAIDGDTTTGTTNGGKEVWAYIPSSVLHGPTSSAVDGIASRANLTIVHKQLVNATPVAQDVDFSRTFGASPTASGDWHTLLVGGLGKGGRGFYAVDVTTPPAAFADTESTIAGKILWEFTDGWKPAGSGASAAPATSYDSDLGYSLGRPLITKLRKYGWVVIVTSGYNNVSGSNPGKGVLYILNAKTGALLEKIVNTVGSATSPSGLAQITGYTPNYADYTTDQVYGGDLLGNLWRYDLTASSGAYPAPQLFATVSDGSNPQPITSAPQIEIDVDDVSRWVFVGTGKLLDNTDMADSQQQTMYAFKDGTKSTPTAATTPLTRSNLTAATNLLSGVTYTPGQESGWYYDLLGIDASTGGRERISANVVANQGVISWVGLTPQSGNACAPGAAATAYSTAYGTAISVLFGSGGAKVPNVQSTTSLVKLQFVNDQFGNVRQIATTGDPTATNQVQPLTGDYGGWAGIPRRVSWREIIRE